MRGRWLLSTWALVALVFVAMPAHSEPCPGAPVVVFDIDGTLTLEDGLPWTVRSGAQAAVAGYVDRGYEVVFLSARPSGDFSWMVGLTTRDVAEQIGLCGELCEEICLPLVGCNRVCTPDPCDSVEYLDALIDLSDLTPYLTPSLVDWLTRRWISDNGIPMPDRLILSEELLINDAERAAFKTAKLQEIAQSAPLFVGYGDSVSDFWAYNASNMLSFATRRVSAPGCLGEGWSECIEHGFEAHTARFIESLPHCSELQAPKQPACGLGFEIVPIMALLQVVRQRRRRKGRPAPCSRGVHPA